MSRGVNTTPHMATMAAVNPVDSGAAATGLAATIGAASPFIWLKLNDAIANPVDYGSRVSAVTGVSIGSPANLEGPDGDSYVLLDGTNDYYNIDDADDLSIVKASGMTICVAHRPTGLDGTDTLWSKAVSGNVEYIMDANGGSNASRVVWGQASSSSSYSENSLAAAVATDGWHFTIVRCETDGGISVWQDSLTPDSSLAVNRVGTASEAGAGALQVGGWSSFGGYRHQGHLAHFAMWDEALSTPAIEALMQAAIDEGWTA